MSQAKENIEGKISTVDVHHRLEEYYQQKDAREKAEADRTLEAYGVSERINALLAQKALTFSPMELAHIHGCLFKGILPHAGLSAHIISPKLSGSLTAIQLNMATPGI